MTREQGIATPQANDGNQPEHPAFIAGIPLDPVQNLAHARMIHFKAGRIPYRLLFPAAATISIISLSGVITGIFAENNCEFVLDYLNSHQWFPNKISNNEVMLASSAIVTLISGTDYIFENSDGRSRFTTIFFYIGGMIFLSNLGFFLAASREIGANPTMLLPVFSGLAAIGSVSIFMQQFLSRFFTRIEEGESISYLGTVAETTIRRIQTADGVATVVNIFLLGLIANPFNQDCSEIENNFLNVMVGLVVLASAAWSCHFTKQFTAPRIANLPAFTKFTCTGIAALVGVGALFLLGTVPRESASGDQFFRQFSAIFTALFGATIATTIESRIFSLLFHAPRTPAIPIINGQEVITIIPDGQTASSEDTPLIGNRQ